MSQQNMFLEGLHQVYMTPASPPSASTSTDHTSAQSNDLHLDNARIHRWFGTVVNTRLLLCGVVQVLSAVACILTTVIYTCVSYNCAVAMATPVWSSLLYLASGFFAMEVQRRATKAKILVLVAANIFTSVFGFSAMMSTAIKTQDASALNPKQRVASYVAKGSSITFTVQCLLASLYVILLCWKGLQRYSPPPSQTYSRVNQEADDSALLENMEYDL